jgi:hypothetical protein
MTKVLTEAFEFGSSSQVVRTWFASSAFAWSHFDVAGLRVVCHDALEFCSAKRKHMNIIKFEFATIFFCLSRHSQIFLFKKIK